MKQQRRIQASKRARYLTGAGAYTSPRLTSIMEATPTPGWAGADRVTMCSNLITRVA